MASSKNLRPLFPQICFMAVLIFLTIPLIGCEEEGGPPHGVREIPMSDNYIKQDYDIYLVLAFPKKADNPEKQKYITRQMVDDVLDYYHLLYKANRKVKILLYHNTSGARQAVTSELYGELDMENGEPKLKINHLR